MATKYPSVAAAKRYAERVVAKKIPACNWVIKACARHLDDLKREKTNKFPYRFDPQKGERVCQFIQRLPHTKGRWASKAERIKLEPWQCWLLSTLFGWVRKSDGNRRFREAYLEVPRKNGKSIIAAGVGLYCLVADGEFGAEVYSGATSEKQAWEVFRPARLMAARTPALCEHFGLEVNAASLSRAEDASRFEPLIGNPGDGSSPSCALIDEFHEHEKPDLYDTMVTGMGSREQPLVLIITTAGADISGPCYEKRIEVTKILDGIFHDEQTFGVIYTLDEGDDWTQPIALRKANPNYGVSVDDEYLQSQVRKALQSPSKQNSVKTKHFNLWVGSRTAWLSMEDWKACANPNLRIEDFLGQECYLSVDLASRIDLAASGHLFSRWEDDGRQHYYYFPRFYLPEAALEGSKNADRYRGWNSQGYLQLIDGEEVDFNALQEEFLQTPKSFKLLEFVYDPWQATQIAQTLRDQRVETVEFRNIVSTMSPAMKELEGAVTSGRFHHPGNPVLDWMASNVTVKPDAKENIYPRKDVPENKIDGMISLIMGVGRAAVAEDNQSVYEKRGIRTL